MTSPMKLPVFEYFPGFEAEGCLSAEGGTCPCCEEERSHIYEGPIYSTFDIAKVCPWCIENGSAAEKWEASFNDVRDVPNGVPADVVKRITSRTPGYVTWQGNTWLFSQSDALAFVGEVSGDELLAESDTGKITACRNALAEWGIGDDFDLADITIAGQPAVYLFRDRQTGVYEAYADMT